MSVIYFIRENITKEYDEPITISQSAIDVGIMIGDGLCGIKRCGRCKVLVTKGNDRVYSQEEDILLTKEEKSKGIRLACCYRPTQDVAVMTYSNNDSDDGTKCKLSTGKMDNNKTVYIAIDVGTTNLEVFVLDKEGNEITRLIRKNPLRIIGNDIVSRITYADTYERLMKMHNMLIDECNDMINVLADAAIIEKIGIAGNTVMMHIMTGNDIEKLGRIPFSTGYMGGEILNAKEQGYISNDKTVLYIPPFIREHMGADAMCCLFSDIMSKSNVLIMDIGTNSEMLLIKENDIYACSAAAGPAFEVGNIEGICASELINIIASMKRTGVMDRWGTLHSHASISQQDVRSIQMAKGAIAAAVITMFEHAKINYDDIDKVYLAGNFGTNINIYNAIDAGLIPNIKAEKFECVGNMAARGLMKMLAKDNIFDEMIETQHKIKHISLAEDEEFKSLYIEQMNFI